MKRRTNMALTGLTVDRRGFLTGIGVAISGLPLGAANTANAAGSRGEARRALHGHMPYFDFEGVGVSFDAPRGNASTRDYVNSLAREEFLRRHWFT